MVQELEVVVRMLQQDVLGCWCLSICAPNDPGGCINHCCPNVEGSRHDVQVQCGSRAPWCIQVRAELVLVYTHVHEPRNRRKSFADLRARDGT
eukprot:6481474-Amphidinium_carterae.2